jgi:hypothetical protein
MLEARPKIPNSLKSDEAKRTTIILERSEREYIESLIKAGKEQGIKQLFSKLLDIYKNLNMDDWQYPGEYYCGISRIAIINVEMLNILIQNIPKDKWHSVGVQVGNALKVSVQSTLGVDASKPANWDALFKRLKVQGFGDFYLKDRYLLLKIPFINDCEIWRGLLEGLLGIELETKNALPPLVFEIKTPKSATV